MCVCLRGISKSEWVRGVKAKPGPCIPWNYTRRERWNKHLIAITVGFRLKAGECGSGHRTAKPLGWLATGGYDCKSKLSLVTGAWNISCFLLPFKCSFYLSSQPVLLRPSGVPWVHVRNLAKLLPWPLLQGFWFNQCVCVWVCVHIHMCVYIFVRGNTCMCMHVEARGCYPPLNHSPS